MHALPVLLAALSVLAISYRYYSAFLAARVLALDGSRPTPAVRLADGQNYVATPKWVLFGHHFAAISGAGPLIGPVLALQYGYAPGLIWLVVGVCLAGAVQDMLVLGVSVRTDGKSLAEIARLELGPAARVVVAAAVLIILAVALAGLGVIVVKALGGEEANLPTGMAVRLPEGASATADGPLVKLPPGCAVRYAAGQAETVRSEAFAVRFPAGHVPALGPLLTLPGGSKQVIAGSSWGAFTIACTVPIALLVGLWMQRIRPGRTVEASLIGAALVLGATVLGGLVPGSRLESVFSLSQDQTLAALMVYGVTAAVLPVWLLLGPRDYLSSFLKLGTVALLLVSVAIANPPLHAPPFNEVFRHGGPTFQGGLFPFVFICVMCGAVSGFHSLVASGTTPKMIASETHVRTVGYGAMCFECVVAITALIAAACLPPQVYYDINVPIELTERYQPQLAEVAERYDPLHAVAGELGHHDLRSIEEKVGGESLRGRSGGAVTLAVGMSVVFEQAFVKLGFAGERLLKYWYHFALMFEALFILTTIDAGTRIGRFLLQESLGGVWPRFARPDWIPGALLASTAFTLSWGWLIHAGTVGTIWSMFGVANQLLAVLALTLVSVWLANHGRARYLWVTLIPLAWVLATTLTAARELMLVRFPADIRAGKVTAGVRNTAVLAVILCLVLGVVAWAGARIVAVWLRSRISERGVSAPRGSPSLPTDPER